MLSKDTSSLPLALLQRTSACALHINGRPEPVTDRMTIRFVRLPGDCLQPVLYDGDAPVEGDVQLCLTLGDL